MLIGEETRRALPDGSVVEPVPGLRVKGKELAVDAYLLHALPGSAQGNPLAELLPVRADLGRPKLT